VVLLFALACDSVIFLSHFVRGLKAAKYNFSEVSVGALQFLVAKLMPWEILAILIVPGRTRPSDNLLASPVLILHLRPF
jgi:hypothetical protein